MNEPAACQALCWLAYNISFNAQDGCTYEVGAEEEKAQRGEACLGPPGGAGVQTWLPYPHAALRS